MRPTVHEFREIICQVCQPDTSADSIGWKPENPLWGHCAVVSLLAQEIYGGTLRRVSLLSIPRFASMRSHYFNSFSPVPVGSQMPFDFTREQFGSQYIEVAELPSESRDRYGLLENVQTRQRYELLKERFERFLLKDLYRELD